MHANTDAPWWRTDRWTTVQKRDMACSNGSQWALHGWYVVTTCAQHPAKLKHVPDIAMQRVHSPKHTIRKYTRKIRNRVCN